MGIRATVFIRVVNKEGHTAFALNLEKMLPPDPVTGEERIKPKGWSLIGGRVQNDETLLEAAKRECREEAGLKIDPEKLIEIPSAFEPSRNGKPEVHVFYTHEFEFLNGECLTTKYEAEESAGVIEARWASDSEWEQKYLYSKTEDKEYEVYGVVMRRIRKCNEYFETPR